MAIETGKRDESAPKDGTGVKRRGLLRFGTLITAFSGVSAISALGASTAYAAPGDKNPPTTTYVPTAEKGSAAGVATLDANTRIPYAQLPDLSSSFVAWENAAKHGAVGDDATNSRDAIDAAILTCSNAGGGIVFLPPGRYVVGGPITPRSNVTVYGPGVTIRTTVADNVFYARTVACKDFTIDGLTIVGSVTSYPRVPTRARVTSGPGCVSAFQASGDTDTDSPGGARIENITVRNCTFRNCSGLPVLLKGIRGILRVQNNEFTNNMDVGFVFYEELIFTGNHVYGSADNGVSASRGGQKITITGNTFENCAYNGIFVAGFLADKGPQNFTISGNVVKDVGNSGIYLDAAPKHGVVTGNELDGGYFRGPADYPTDGAVSGVFIGGYPTTDRATPTDWAEGITVAGNQIRRFPRAGIHGTALRRVLIVGNQISDIGSQYMANGTPVPAAEPLTNVGILIENAATTSQTVVAMNHITDSRTTPYCNWGIIPVGSAALDEFMNTMYGCRNPYNLVETGQTRNINWGAVFQQNTKHTAGSTAGATAATGTVAGFDINGAPGSTRRHKILSAGSDRWQFGGSGDAESGANAGTNFRINAYDDAGIFIKKMLDITRDGKIAFAGANAVSPPTLPAAATDTATTQALVNAIRAALIANGLAV